MKINRFKAIALGLTTLVGGAIGAQAQTNQAAELDVEFALTNSQPIISVAAPLVNLSGGNIITDTNGALANSSFAVDLGAPVITVDGSGKIAGVTFATVTETDPKTGDSIVSPQAVNITGNLGDKGSTPTITLSLAGKGAAEITDTNGNLVGGKATLSLKFSGQLVGSAGSTTITSNTVPVTNCTFVTVTNAASTPLTNFTYVSLTNNSLGTMTNATLITNSSGVTVTNGAVVSTNYFETNSIVGVPTVVIGTNSPYFALTATNSGYTFFTNVCAASGTVPSTNFAAISDTNTLATDLANTNGTVVTNTTASITNYIALATNNVYSTNASGVTNTMTVVTNISSSTNVYFSETTNTVTFNGTNYVNTNYVALTNSTANTNTTGFAGVVTNTTPTTNLIYIESNAPPVLGVVSNTAFLGTNSYSYFFRTTGTTNICTNSLPEYASCVITNEVVFTTNTTAGGAAIEGFWTGSFKPGIKHEETINLSKKPGVTGEIGSPSLGEGTEIDVNMSIAALLASNAKSVTFYDAGLIMPIDATLGTAFDSLAGTGSGSGKGGSKPSFSLSIAGTVLNSKGSSIMLKGTLGDNPLNIATANGGLGADPATVFLNVSATGKVLGQKVKVAAGNGAAEIPPIGPPFPAAGF